MAAWQRDEIILNRAETHEVYAQWLKDRRGGLAHRVEGRDARGRALKEIIGAGDYRPRDDGKADLRAWRVPQLDVSRMNLAMSRESTTVASR